MVIASTSHFNYSVDQLITFFSFEKKSHGLSLKLTLVLGSTLLCRREDDPNPVWCQAWMT